MMIKFNPALIANHYILYVLRDAHGEIQYINVVRYGRLFSGDDIPRTDSEYFLSIMNNSDDFLGLINQGLAFCDSNNRPDLRAMLDKALRDWSCSRRCKPVVCIETGERFNSAKECSKAHDLCYNSLLQHLGKDRGIKRVGTNKYTYEYIYKD